jgi:hypothetical protein
VAGSRPTRRLPTRGRCNNSGRRPHTGRGGVGERHFSRVLTLHLDPGVGRCRTRASRGRGTTRAPLLRDERSSGRPFSHSDSCPVVTSHMGTASFRLPGTARPPLGRLAPRRSLAVAVASMPSELLARGVGWLTPCAGSPAVVNSRARRARHDKDDACHAAAGRLGPVQHEETQRPLEAMSE